jgi:hypothetical protein
LRSVDATSLFKSALTFKYTKLKESVLQIAVSCKSHETFDALIKYLKSLDKNKIKELWLETNANNETILFNAVRSNYELSEILELIQKVVKHLSADEKRTMFHCKNNSNKTFYELELERGIEYAEIMKTINGHCKGRKRKYQG